LLGGLQHGPGVPVRVRFRFDPDAVQVSGDLVSPSSVVFCTHPWVCDHAWCLGLHYTLDESQTAYTYSGQFIVHSAEYVGFDGGHKLP
jgi:hypothetical protein